MTGGSKVYRVSLTREVFYKKAAPVFEEICSRIGRLYERYGKNKSGPVLLLSDRVARLPGIKDMLAAIEKCKIIHLQPGAGARGILRLSHQLFDQQGAGSAPFLKVLPLPIDHSISDEIFAQQQLEIRQRPTHILYRHLAYPITEKPLIIGLETAADNSGIQIRRQRVPRILGDAGKDRGIVR